MSMCYHLEGDRLGELLNDTCTPRQIQEKALSYVAESVASSTKFAVSTTVPVHKFKLEQGFHHVSGIKYKCDRQSNLS